MTAAEGSYLGFAKQVSAGTPIVADASFTYLLFQDGGLSPNNVYLPTEPEVGGGAFQRNVLKAGVYSAGRLTFIPRPASLGFMLHGLLGCVTTTDLTGGAYSHVFAPLDVDQFSAPYFTARQAPGNIWGESMQDVRFSALSLNWRGGNFLRGEVAMIGGLPVKVASMATWLPAAKVDSGPQFLAPLSKIEVPDATVLSVLSGSFAASASIPLDEQWIVGSYAPQGLDIVQKAFMLSLAIKITDATLYSKIMYDPAAGSAWVASMFKEANLDISFVSDALAKTAVPYSVSIAANGHTGDGLSNVAWTAQPLNLRAGKQIVMGITGMFLADHAGGDPLTVTLVNQKISY